MKQFEPNSLHRELARGPQAGRHPDADMLAAFAEGSLLERERNEVLAHLAICMECREVLSLAGDAAPLPAIEAKPFLLPRPAHPPLRTWAPWVGLAAGILVVCSVARLQLQKPSVQHSTIATVTPPSQPVPIQSPAPLKRSPKKAAAPAPSQQPKAPPQPQALPTPDSIRAADSVMERGHGTERTRSSLGAKAPAEASATQAIALRPSAPSQSVTSFAGSAETDALTTASVAATVRPHWRINEQGKPERSFGDGPWQAVLPSETSRMHVVSVANAQVWAGGEKSTLYRSPDNGITWNRVALPDKNGSEHVLVHIRFETIEAGTIEASDGTRWTSADGGNTWQ